jgi:hypothetical protein
MVARLIISQLLIFNRQARPAQTLFKRFYKCVCPTFARFGQASRTVDALDLENAPRSSKI